MLLDGCRRLALPTLLLIRVGAVMALPSSAAAATSPAAPEVRAEIARGASAIAAVSAKKFPYATAYRLMRARLEENVQKRHDSDAFLVGAHLVIAVWLSALPKDISWREKALARHCDVVGWLLPRLGLLLKEVRDTTARAAKLTPAQGENLSELLQDITAQKTGSKH